MRYIILISSVVLLATTLSYAQTEDEIIKMLAAYTCECAEEKHAAYMSEEKTLKTLDDCFWDAVIYNPESIPLMKAQRDNPEKKKEFDTKMATELAMDCPLIFFQLVPEEQRTPKTETKEDEK